MLSKQSEEETEQLLAQALIALDGSNTLNLVARQLEMGHDPLQIIEQCRAAITEVGERFGRGEYYLSELIMGGNIFLQCMELIEPYLEGDEAGPHLGTVVIGTVRGDIHDLGKNIVATLLRCDGFEVIDLGVDVRPERFVEAISEAGAKIIGMSCLLTTGFDAMKSTVEAIEQAGMREQVKILVGGGCVNERVRDYVGADFYGKDAVEAVRASRRYLGYPPP